VTIRQVERRGCSTVVAIVTRAVTKHHSREKAADSPIHRSCYRLPFVVVRTNSLEGSRFALFCKNHIVDSQLAFATASSKEDVDREQRA
jgi:hypothetical protein